MRQYFFGPDGSTAWSVLRLTSELGDRYTHFDVDIRDRDGLAAGLQEVRPGHRRGDPHGRPAEPRLGRQGAVHRLRRQRRRHPQRAGEHPAVRARGAVHLLLDQQGVRRPPQHACRWWSWRRGTRSRPGHPYEQGITEEMSIDDCLHSIFGVSKVAADIMVQEYGRYFDMRTASFRGGTLTGPAHSAAELHGFLAYLMRCVMEGRTYNLYGYKGKMVRDAIHSHDVLTAFEAFFREPALGRGLQPGRRPLLQHLAHRGVPDGRGDHRPRGERSTTWSRTGSATTSGGSAAWPGSRPTTRTGR